jgi:hypothetical protein
MAGVPDNPTSGIPGALPDDLRSDVYDIVSDAVQWRLPGEDWPKIEALVDALYQSLRSGDPAAVKSAVIELELAAPLRITPIGGPPTDPASARLRRVAETIVHDLGEGLDLRSPQSKIVDDESGTADDAAGH